MSDPDPANVFVPVVDAPRLAAHGLEELEKQRRKVPPPAAPTERAHLTLAERGAADQDRMKHLERLLGLALEKTQVRTLGHRICHLLNPKQRAHDRLVLEFLTSMFEAYRGLSYDMLDVLRREEEFRTVIAVEQQQAAEQIDALSEQVRKLTGERRDVL